MKSRGVMAYLRDRWRSEVLHEPTPADDRSAQRQPPVRRSHSQPPARKSAATDDPPTTRWRRLSRRQPASPRSPPVYSYDHHRDVGVQCAIISWNALTRRAELAADFRSPADDADFSSQEISLAATDGSGTTTLGDAADIEFIDNDNDDDDDDDDDGADFGWFGLPDRALAVHSAPPPTDLSQSTTTAPLEPSRVGGALTTRVAQLRSESTDHAVTPAQGSSCYSEPEVVRCCSATAAGVAVPRVDVAALRRQFRRRKAITLADFDVQHRYSRLYESTARESISQKSAVTQQRSS